MGNIATFDAKGKLTLLDLRSARHMTDADLRELSQAVERGSSQIIQRAYTGETGKWAHDGLLRLLTQFRTFGVVGIEKQWGRNRTNFGATKAFGYLVGSMSMAIPVHYARAYAKAVAMSEDKRTEYLDAVLSPAAVARATTNYASASGYAGDIWDTGGGMFNSWFGDDELAKVIGIRTGGTRGAAHALIPGVGLIDDLVAGANGNPNKLVKLLPGSNLPYLAPMFNVASEPYDELTGNLRSEKQDFWSGTGLVD
jgi:hypothetical protein